MKSLGPWCFAVAILIASVLMMAGKVRPSGNSGELPLGGFIKPGDRAGLIGDEKPSSLVLRVLSEGIWS